MIGVLYSILDIASVNMANYLEKEHGFEEIDEGSTCAYSNKACIVKTSRSLLELNELDRYNFELIYFLSKHSSAKGIAAFTTHPTGNWTKEAKLGGKPYEISYSAPLEMLSILKEFKKSNNYGLEVSYEATHHGPLLKTPSLFVEVGGNEDTVGNKDYAKVAGEAVYNSIYNDGVEFSKVVIGIGNTHYPAKFSELALNKGYAFAHMLPKHSIEGNGDNLFMLEQAVKRTKNDVEIAVIDWKSLNSETRTKVISKLNELGIDYERV